MGKNVFVNNGKAIDVAHGKMQWNTANADFRAAMQYRYDAAVKLADAKAQASDDIKTLRNMIAFAEKQTYVNSTEIDGYNAKIDEINDGIKAMQTEFNAAAPAISDADKNLYIAYRAAMNDEEDELSGNTYQRAFYEWADFNGVKPTAETFNFFCKKIGIKKLSAKAIVKSNGEKFTGALSATAFYTVFYGIVMECLKAQNLLRSYEFTYKFPERKSNKNA